MPMTLLDRFITFLDSLPDSLLYLGLAASAFAENIFPPVPGDTITAFGAFLVGVGRLTFAGVYAATTLGSVLGFLGLYWVGGRMGRSSFLQRHSRHFSAERIRRAEAWASRYGHYLVLINRFLPGARSVISIGAGIVGLTTWKVALFALLSAAAWNLLWIWAGFLLGTHWDTVQAGIRTLLVRYNLAVALILALGGIIYLLRRRRRSS